MNSQIAGAKIMSRFVLIDHSIKRLGGHNFEYAMHVLQAAEDAGYIPVLVVNERFFEAHRLPQSWNVMPIYRHTTYEVPKWQKFQKHIATKKLSPLSLLTYPVDRIRLRRYEKLLSQFANHFVEDTLKVYDQLRLVPGDQVMFSTIMQSELAGLVQLFKQRPEAAKIDCHAMFHFQLFKGRDPDYQNQMASADEFQQLLRQITSLPDQRLHCYCTNDALAQQYRLLNCINVDELPWSVNPQFGAKPNREERNPEHPIRIGIPGCTRDERGMPLLEQLVSSLEKEFLHDHTAQLVVQAKRLGKLSSNLRRVAKFHKTPQNAVTSHAPVAVVKWPLSTEDYFRMVEMTDIGLLLYEAKEYYARASGVLVEMLNSGIPVIVSSASWLSEQISHANWEHVDHIIDTVPALATLNTKQLEWQLEPSHDSWTKPTAPRIFSASKGEATDSIVFGSEKQRRKVAVATVPKNATHLAVRFAWHAPQSTGVYVDLQVEARNRYGLTSQRWHEITGRRDDPSVLTSAQNSAPQLQGLLIPLPADSSIVELTFSNAFGELPIELENLECRFLDAFATPHGCPLSAVGLQAADPSMAPALVREMLKHYDHYRVTAAQHAIDYRDLHSPKTVVQILRAKSERSKPSEIRRVG